MLFSRTMRCLVAAVFAAVILAVPAASVSAASGTPNYVAFPVVKVAALAGTRQQTKTFQVNGDGTAAHPPYAVHSSEKIAKVLLAKAVKANALGVSLFNISLKGTAAGTTDDPAAPCNWTWDTAQVGSYLTVRVKIEGKFAVFRTNYGTSVINAQFFHTLCAVESNYSALANSAQSTTLDTTKVPLATFNKTRFSVKLAEHLTGSYTDDPAYSESDVHDDTLTLTFTRSKH